MKEKININIWDDYYEDTYEIPDGEIQETYLYVEEYDIFSEDDKKKILLFLKHEIDKLKFPIKTRLSFYDTEKEYPDLDFKANGLTPWTRYEVRLENLSHDLRLELLDNLQKLNLIYNNHKFNFYSES